MIRAMLLETGAIAYEHLELKRDRQYKINHTSVISELRHVLKSKAYESTRELTSHKRELNTNQSKIKTLWKENTAYEVIF